MHRQKYIIRKLKKLPIFGTKMKITFAMILEIKEEKRKEIENRRERKKQTKAIIHTNHQIKLLRWQK